MDVLEKDTSCVMCRAITGNCRDYVFRDTICGLSRVWTLGFHSSCTGHYITGYDAWSVRLNKKRETESIPSPLQMTI